jgi:hypothetical protein
MPEGMAGACQVTRKGKKMRMKKTNTTKRWGWGWRNDEEVDFEGDQDDYDSITIKAVGIDFPMCCYTKQLGIWALLKSGAIKEDEEMAQLIAKTHLHLKMSHKTLDMVLLCKLCSEISYYV